MLAAVALVAAPDARAAGATDDDLPSGALAIAETRQVAAEICRDHLFDPAAAGQLPEGYRLVLAAEAAAKDPALARVLQAQPARGAYAFGTLCFLSVGQYVVDRTPVQAHKPLATAFWWAAVDGPRDPRMRGKASWLQLGSWFASDTPDRASILRADPMAEFVGVEVEQREPHRWHLRLVLPAETVTAEVTVSGHRVPSRAQQPGVMSVAMGGRGAGHFSVFSYHGHHHQSAQGTWRASGSGVWGEALALSTDADAFRTLFQDGWSARAGLYRRSGR